MGAGRILRLGCSMARKLTQPTRTRGASAVTRRDQGYAIRVRSPVSFSLTVRACLVAGFAVSAGCSATTATPKTPSPDSPPGLVALETELARGMRELGGKGKPPAYFIAYEVHDRSDVTVAASYGALVQSSTRRARILDTDVRVG